MNIKPRLDTKIPKCYMYITINNENRHNLTLEKIKGKKDTESVKKRKQAKGYLSDAQSRHTKFKSGDEINLYSHNEKIHEFTRKSSHIDFENEYVIKINPICMFKTFNNYGRDTYDLYSFTVDKIFYTQEELMKSLKKDGIVEEYILSTYLSLLASNKEYIDIRNNFIEYVITNYNDNRPSFANIVARLKGKDWESSSLYKASDYKVKYYKEAYDKGFLRLNEDYYDEATLIFLLKNRMFDLIPQAIEGTTEYFKETLNEYVDKYAKYENTICIKKLLLDNLDNQHCKWLYDLIGFKETGYTLKIMEWDEDYRKDYVKSSNNFKTIEEVKKFIVRNYECDFNKVAKSEFDNLRVSEDGDIWYDVKLEYVE